MLQMATVKSGYNYELLQKQLMLTGTVDNNLTKLSAADARFTILTSVYNVSFDSILMYLTHNTHLGENPKFWEKFKPKNNTLKE
jgi:hypothetical protein